MKILYEQDLQFWQHGLIALNGSLHARYTLVNVTNVKRPTQPISWDYRLMHQCLFNSYTTAARDLLIYGCRCIIAANTKQPWYK